jgi:hypothetical protein
LKILPAESSSGKAGRTSEGNDEFGLTSSVVQTSNGSLTCHRILRHGANGFNSSPKEGVLQIFIALKNPLSSVGFEPANLVSNGKHANHYTTEDDVTPMIG